MFMVKPWYSFTMFFSKVLSKFRKKKITKVKIYDTIEEIPKAFNNGKDYRSDMFFGRKSDHLTHPTVLQGRIEDKEKFGDCDDHAIYWCAALIKSKLASKVWLGFYHMINEESGEITGHAVCVFADHSNVLHWADYRNPRKISKVVGPRDFMIQSAYSYGKKAIKGAIILIKELDENDTPKFGKITRF
jgi:hypothetical protein